MKPDIARELDRGLVHEWLLKINNNPTLAYVTYTKEQHQICASDALDFLAEQIPVKPVRNKKLPRCWACGNCGEYVGFEDSDDNDSNEYDNYCRKCGRPVMWRKEISDAEHSDL